jgi:S-DNA-T family DNA segregation ATPase FtsK/SpoIIIE
MAQEDRLEKIEKQLELLLLKVDIIYHKLSIIDYPIQSYSSGAEDELYDEAKEIVIKARKASAGNLQRHLRIGYARAARLLDILEEKGVIGPAEGARPRDVLIDK